MCKSLSPFHKTIPGKCRGLLTSRKDSLRQIEKLQFEQQQQKCGPDKPLRKTKKDSAYLWNAACDKNLQQYRRLIIIIIIIPLFTLRSIYCTNVSEAEQIPETNNSTWINRVKNHNWPEANQLPGYLQVWSRIWTRDYHEQIQLAVRGVLELGTSELQVRCSYHSATLPPWKCSNG